MKRIIFLLFCAFALISCEKDSNVDHKVYFEYYAINYAREISNVHWIINNEGNVLTNRKKDSFISLNDNLSYANILFDSVIYKIKKQELEHYVALIEPASKGELDTISRSRADFGGTAFNCFLHNNINSPYKTILVSYMGDAMDIINTDSSAKKIDEWLKDIHRKIYSN